MSIRKILVTLSLFALVPAAFAQTVGGSFRTETGNGTRTVEFSATGDPRGGASGDIALTEPVAVPDQDVDGDGSADPELKEGTTLTLRIAVDCMTVEGNRAVIGGVVRDSNVRSYFGRRMLLTVEDNAGSERRDPDRFAFGFYRATAPTWVPSDAELERDPGVGLTWWATDAEREDDTGISSEQPKEVDCHAFALSSFDLEDLPAEAGDVQIRP